MRGWLDRHHREVSQHLVRQTGQDDQQCLMDLPAQLMSLAALGWTMLPAAIVKPPGVAAILRSDLGRAAEQLLAS
ncbi:MAG: hypothetical protein MUF18_20310 [Fimbriiglobus sp.]|jgi:hypothetical protein|nr:hypothetical protein [Fimbriiglobus sp.]